MIQEQAKRRVYFIDGPVPSAEERAEAIAQDCLSLRNLRHVQPDKLEDVAAVAGKVPECYKGLKGVKVIPSQVKTGPWLPAGRVPPAKPAREKE